MSKNKSKTSTARIPKNIRLKYTAANRKCARIIVEDPERYGGLESLMVQWALRILREETRNGQQIIG